MRATPEFDFGLSEQTLMLRDTVARFADERIAPIAAACALVLNEPALM